MAADQKLLAEWFWTDRWMGSSGFLLAMEPRGLYREMLTQAWRRGARLPADHEEICRAVGCTLAEWKRCWPKLERFWRADGDALVNDTQLEVYAEAQGVQQRAHERGVKGAQARAQALAQAKREHTLKSQPPTPTQTPNVLSERSPREPRTVPDEPKNQIQWLQERYAELHAEIVGVGYIGNPVADYREWQALLPLFGVELLEKLMVYWLNTDDEFTRKGTRTVAKFRSRASKYAEELKAKKLA